MPVIFDRQMVAVVTGGSGGIGKYLTHELANAGAKVVFTYNTDKHQAEEILAEAEHNKKEMYAVKTNILDKSEIDTLFSYAYKKFGRIDILINNAGVFSDGLVQTLPREEWEKVINVNLTGNFLCSQAVLPYMVKKRFGRIINVSSVYGQAGAIGAANYAASKSGLEGLTKSLAKEVGRLGITVNMTSLGFINAGMGLKLSEKVADNFIRLIPMGKKGDPVKVARSILFLATDDAEYITGHVLNINGGYYM